MQAGDFDLVSDGARCALVSNEREGARASAANRRGREVRCSSDFSVSSPKPSVLDSPDSTHRGRSREKVYAYAGRGRARAEKAGSGSTEELECPLSPKKTLCSVLIYF